MQIPSIFPVTSHTDHVGPGSTFVAVKGIKHDGIDYIPLALERGATTIVIATDVIIPLSTQQDIIMHGSKLIRVADSRLALAQLSAQAAGYPAQKLRIIGITGTKGKTTSSFLLEHLLRSAGYTTAMLSTVYNKIGDTLLPTSLTTQHPDYLHQFFKLCVDTNIDYVVMEVAAQAISLHRVQGLIFDAVLFTNFSQEHAEFYRSLEDYFAAKAQIVQMVKSHAPVVINGDDAWCIKLLNKSHQGPGDYGTFGIATNVTFKGECAANTSDHVAGTLTWLGGKETFVCPTLLGRYNCYNVLGVISLVLAHFGIDWPVIAQGLSTFSGVPGRLQRHILRNGATCIIDYAHNPSSFESVLSTLRLLTGQLIVVFGCGGERDATKRPMMGAIAAMYADLVVVTSDNPRSENPQEIINDIIQGISPENRIKVYSALDREQAIVYAYKNSHATSIIALLGKGPDEYQIIGTHKIPFSEAAIVQGL